MATSAFGGVDISQFNFNDKTSRADSVRIANGILIGLVLVVIGLRLFSRLKFLKRIFVDDILITIAAVFTLALASTSIAATSSGLGTHVWLLPLPTLFEQVKSCILYLLICQVLYACAIGCTKVAIISSYLRLIQGKTFRLIMYMTLFIVVGLWICGIFVSLFQCDPVDQAWKIDPNRKCINYVNYLYASSAVNVFTDVVLCILPIPYLWKLKMPVRQRIVLCLLFVGGAGACIAGIIRIAYLDTLRVLDVLFETVPILNLSVIECSLGIICVSIPALRPMVVQIFPNGSRASQTASTTMNKPYDSGTIPLSEVSGGFPKTAKLPPINEANTRPFERLSSV
ncbi:hypothetical protein HBI56_032730 [Parastagonospora nodorum]|uniref:Rhodopsin domain-containing protein n=1 Tax=Phaeosphaeria nodorum (strain SN15 / ATCC MYA-4574 / FGSC 10173) TaxID=321614 RepID=A0A7U2EYS1_PHANO|nr:hypothetical protein HBH56_020530 [Parastagonospora nodorum]QRC95432.1 hypothetical protein JI435_031200 [Parastagonospora nodorum SN15]KAH3936781.1 hypothetical protein HBH54_013980 [Parastagonospora nodorum]KAH3967460.1 hypothetical protein HBH51_137700 [Parastagonospora nodorum]KAH3990691.1 hypothetical protein HBH52_002920 [Parastagonospora nodorum]